VPLRLKSMFLGCLAVLILFAGSARAQQVQEGVQENVQEDQGTTVDPKLQKMLDEFKTAKPASRDASVQPASQQQVKREGVTSEADTCAYTFTSGSGYTYLQFCVTVNGNIVEFQSPVGVEQINQGGIGEGYGVCDVNTGVGYFDFSDEGASGWGSPVLNTHNGTLVKITRTTTDGLWTLIQTITNLPGANPAAKVTMQLKNNSSTTKEAFLFRWADVDPGRAAQEDEEPDGFLESFDSSFSAAWGYVPANGSESGAPSYGLMFQNSGNLTPSSVGYAREGYSLYASGAPSACNPSASFANALTNTDGAILFLWLADNIAKNQIITVNGKYFAF
jgi:hypothetical protein